MPELTRTKPPLAESEASLDPAQSIPERTVDLIVQLDEHHPEIGVALTAFGDSSGVHEFQATTRVLINNLIRRLPAKDQQKVFEARYHRELSQIVQE